ncbi:MAG TPA: nuclear transport factor 2 family protein [Actinopolymorphaceae bacterium]
MTSHPRADRFAAALRHFEESGEIHDLARQFADNAELVRPEVSKSAVSAHDLTEFWNRYLSQFSHVRTDFTRVDESGRIAVLEWVSNGRLAAGRDIEYRGVSLLTFDGNDEVRRFATYYDTAAFVQPEN